MKQYKFFTAYISILDYTKFYIARQRTPKHIEMAVVISCVEVILLVLLKTILACDYKEFGMDHTMCSYPSTTCPILRSGFSETEKEEILRAHNELRQKVAKGEQRGQPKASNMRELGWSEELAKVAQKWADQCVSGHDRNRRTKTFNYVGQNVYTFWSTSNAKPNVVDAVSSWYDEVERPGFDSGSIDPFRFSHPAGHYTQLVWAATKAIGCGYVFYNKFNMYTHHTVCNYGPGGNLVGGQMYKIGKPCSKCINGCSDKYPALCGGGGTGAIPWIRNETSEDFKIDVKENSKLDGDKDDLKLSLDMGKSVDMLTRLFQIFSKQEEIYVQIPRNNRPSRQADYNRYNGNNNGYSRNNDPMWKRAFDFFFGPCDGAGSNTQY